MLKDGGNSEFSDYWVSPEDVSGIMRKIFVRRSIGEARKYLERKYENNIPDFDKVLTDYNSIFSKSDESTVSLSNFYLIRTLKEIMKNPQNILTAFEKSKDSEEFWKWDSEHSYIYTSDMEGNFIQAAYDVFHNFRDKDGKPFQKEKILSFSDKEKDEFLKFLKNNFNVAYKDFSATLTKNYIKGIVTTLEKLRLLGVLDSLIEKNNSDRRLMGLEVLNFEMTGDKSGDRYGMEDLMDENVLKGLPLEKLALMHGFYSNKLKKITDMMGVGLFICGRLPGKENIKSEDEELEEALKIYAEYLTVEGIYTSALPKIYDNLKRYTVEGVYKGRKYVVASKEKIYEDFFEKFEKEYFVRSNCKGILPVDFDNYLSTQVTDYRQKDFSMEMLLLIADESFNTVNWGYIPEELDDRNSIERNRKNILLAFDIPGFNMPVKLHMPLEKVKNFFENFDKSYMLPNYTGDEDMAVWGKNLGTSVLVPLTPKQRKSVISAVKKMNPKDKFYNFAKHIECMQYDNNLFRFQKWKDPNGRKGERSYTNVITGKQIMPAHDRK